MRSHTKGWQPSDALGSCDTVSSGQGGRRSHPNNLRFSCNGAHSHMFDSKKAAEYLVVAWCKDWPLARYLAVVTEQGPESGDLLAWVEASSAAFPWMPRSGIPYRARITVRRFVAGNWPKLSNWLFNQKDDLSRLKCASQIERLRARDVEDTDRILSADDRRAMKTAGRDMAASTASYRISRDAFKSNQRSAWSVCKP